MSHVQLQTDFPLDRIIITLFCLCCWCLELRLGSSVLRLSLVSVVGLDQVEEKQHIFYLTMHDIEHCNLLGHSSLTSIVTCSC